MKLSEVCAHKREIENLRDAAKELAAKLPLASPVPPALAAKRPAASAPSLATPSLPVGRATAPAAAAKHAARIAAHYAKARAKHPYFCDWVQPHGKTPEEVSKKIAFTLAKIRKYIKDNAKKHVLGWDDLLNCEVWEVFEALATGDTATAVDELYDAVAVLLRAVDVLEGRQSLGKPVSGNPAGKQEKENNK